METSDPENPRIVLAPAPDDRSKAVRLFVNPETIQRVWRDNRRSALGQFAALVHGRCKAKRADGTPYEIATGGLMKATSLYRGINRPHMNGSGMHVYVTQPDNDWVWPYSQHVHDAGPQPIARPKMSVFTTFVEFSKEAIALHAEAITRAGSGQIDGIVHYWEWTLADAQNPSLPDDHGSRYEKRIWP